MVSCYAAASLPGSICDLSFANFAPLAVKRLALQSTSHVRAVDNVQELAVHSEGMVRVRKVAPTALLKARVIVREGRLLHLGERSGGCS